MGKACNKEMSTHHHFEELGTEQKRIPGKKYRNVEYASSSAPMLPCMVPWQASSMSFCYALFSTNRRMATQGSLVNIL